MNQGIAILMTAYNGEKYIAEQIKSIQKQTYLNWKLYIRDDGSSDKTPLIIDEMAKLDPRIIIISDNLGNLGVKAGYMLLLNNVVAKYYFFSDQDDIWLPEKLDRTLKEFENNKNLLPVLVHTNLTTVDESLNVLNKRFYPNSQIDNLNIILSSNSVTGCTVAINEALKQKVSNDVVGNMVMHDWWLALCAVTFGRIYYVNDPMILYRQHSNNQVGTDTTLIAKFHRILDSNSEIDRLESSFSQAEALLKKHGSKMSPLIWQVVSDYCALPHEKVIHRISSIIYRKFRKCSFLGTISFWKILIFQLKSR